jgi:hypothetical protein
METVILTTIKKKHFLVSNNLGIDQERANTSSGLNNK